MSLKVYTKKKIIIVLEEEEAINLLSDLQQLDTKGKLTKALEYLTVELASELSDEI